MLKRRYEPCLPTVAKTVPTGADWLHELKHGGFRLIVQRNGDRVRLFIRPNTSWQPSRPPKSSVTDLSIHQTNVEIFGERELAGRVYRVLRGVVRTYKLLDDAPCGLALSRNHHPATHSFLRCLLICSCTDALKQTPSKSHAKVRAISIKLVLPMLTRL